ncbi:MAG: hypothetical protein QNL04_03605 [SAR324 cluster bacterium]|nr:hypothetical protein [SAR324 cluster bacterium]
MKKFASLALFCSLFPLSGMAGTVNFVPEGILKFDLKTSNSNYSKVYRHRNLEDDLLSQKLRRYGIEDTEVTGDLAEAETITNFSFSYGLSDTWNLQYTGSQVEKARTSNLTLASGASDAATSFVEEYQSQSVSGLGDSQLMLGWRYSYTDKFDFRWNWTYIHDDGASSYDDVAHYNVGTGNKGVLMELLMDYYPLEGGQVFQTSFWVADTEHKSLADENGDLQELRLGQSLGYNAHWLALEGNVFWGAGIEATQQTASKFGDIAFYNEGNKMDFIVRLGYGNMKQLEGDNVPALPWEAEFDYVETILGINANLLKGYRASFSLYF